MIGGKSIIITGASSGIGNATALALARQPHHQPHQGARLLLVARRHDRLQHLSDEVRKLGATAVSASLDLTRSDAVETMIRLAMENFGRIDVLINNAAFGYFGTVEHTPPDL